MLVQLHLQEPILSGFCELPWGSFCVGRYAYQFEIISPKHFFYKVLTDVLWDWQAGSPTPWSQFHFCSLGQTLLRRALVTYIQGVQSLLCDIDGGSCLPNVSNWTNCRLFLGDFLKIWNNGCR